MKCHTFHDFFLQKQIVFYQSEDHDDAHSNMFFETKKDCETVAIKLFFLVMILFKVVVVVLFSEFPMSLDTVRSCSPISEAIKQNRKYNNVVHSISMYMNYSNAVIPFSESNKDMHACSSLQLPLNASIKRSYQCFILVIQAIKYE